MAIVTVRYWAAAKHAAGVAEERLSADTLSELLAAVEARHGSAPDLSAVISRSSFLIDGEQTSGRAPDAIALRDGSVVEVLPPFAGG